MAKSYPEQLGEWIRQRESTQRDKNLVAFLAVRNDVKAAVDAGYAVKTIWANMHEAGRVPFGYDTFLNYVNRLLRQPQGKKPDAQAEAVAPAPASNAAARPEPDARKSSTEPAALAVIPGFTFNPSPDKKDLL